MRAILFSSSSDVISRRSRTLLLWEPTVVQFSEMYNFNAFSARLKNAIHLHCVEVKPTRWTHKATVTAFISQRRGERIC